MGPAEDESKIFQRNPAGDPGVTALLLLGTANNLDMITFGGDL